MIRNRDQLEKGATHQLALDCIQAGIAAAQPDNAIKQALERSGSELRIQDSTLHLDAYSEIVIIGGGKAAAQMARVAEEVLGDHLTEGVVVTNDPVETNRVRVIEGSHPTPDEAGMEGAQEVLSLAEGATEETLVLCLLSGGGSALLPAPADGISLSEMQSLTDDLLASGATIHEINTVRKHLSDIKGGRLATATAPATVVGLVFSDVVGNDLSVIASGPIAPDRSTYDEAWAVLDRYEITPSSAIQRRLDRGVAGEISETPGTDHSAFHRVQTHILADGSSALTAARSVVETSEYTPVILSSRMEGEAREIAKAHVAIAEESRATGEPVEPPVVFLSGGETTVTLRGGGTGGPNQEFVLGGILTASSDRLVLASVDTDGSDGATDAAGALADRTVLHSTDRAQATLEANDAYTYLRDNSALIETGPTGTNVNDLRVIVVPALDESNQIS